MSENLRGGPSFAILTHAKGGFFLLTFLSVRTNFHNAFEYRAESCALPAPAGRVTVPGSASGIHEELSDNRQPGLRTVLSHVVICSEDLLIRRIEGKNFDAWVLAFKPTNDSSSGFFGSRVTDDKEVVVLNRA